MFWRRGAKDFVQVWAPSATALGAMLTAFIGGAMV